MSVEVIINEEKIAEAVSQFEKLALKLQNRQLKLVFSKSEGDMPDRMEELASSLQTLGSEFANFVMKTSKIVRQTGETFGQNLDGSHINSRK